MLTQVTAAAIGGAVYGEDAVLLKIGKRLTHQVGMVQRSQAAIARRSWEARSSAQHLVHASPADGALAASQLPAQLARIMEAETAEMNVELTEIYFGFHELERPAEGAAKVDPKPPLSPPRDDDPELARLHAESALRDEDAASNSTPRDLSHRQQDLWRRAFMEGRGHFFDQLNQVREEAYADGKFDGREEAKEEIAQHKRSAERWNRLALQWNDELGRAEERAASAWSSAREEFDAEYSGKLDSLQMELCELAETLEATEARLAESQAKVDVLRAVIRENCMQMRGGVE